MSISIGEWSHAKITDNVFYDCNIGLEVKDKSLIEIDNVLIAKSRLYAINLYNKNDRYDSGGTALGKKVFFHGNMKVNADKRSSVTIDNKVNQYPKIETFKSLPVVSSLTDWGDLSEVLKSMRNPIND